MQPMHSIQLLITCLVYANNSCVHFNCPLQSGFRRCLKYSFYIRNLQKLHLKELYQHNDNILTTHLLIEGDTVQRDDTRQNSVKDEGIIREQLISGKGWDGVQKQTGSSLEVSCGHAIQAFIYLQAVLPLPVSSLLK